MSRRTDEPDLAPNGWSLQSCLELGALPSAVACARLHAKQVIWELGLADLAETVELIVSELVTNAQRASAGMTGSRYKGRWAPGAPPIRLWLYADRQRVLVEVWDGSNRMPEPKSVDLEAEGGRGLLLVESLTEQWGAYTPEGSSGKTVWAVTGATVGHSDGPVCC
jgi:anti-sigma regulatory factor (Ser/Thr protein kinase)